MARFSYDLPAMEQFISNLDQRISAVESHLTAVRTTASGLTDDYSGAAADAFTDAHDDWQTDSAQYLDKLKALRQQVETCRHNYADAREANRKMFGWSS
ncbi:WXG100 family type VII secretion target [Nocardia stercoris]|uniref:WXG100 family type VII secretion target n=1 Tax=Nocardia stercoris TaxID=2483361 RepID=A0A3M2L2E6_9NOCA|nr:WXG100 family type VII secretion target [Nocardia stercoris]RMI28718.1 WXG100 family type VII secretion target [Nocardia stercoris]